MHVRMALAGAGVSAVLLGLLLLLPGASVGRVGQSVAAVSWTLVLLVAAVEVIILLAGAQKWRLSVAWFRREAGRPPLLGSLEATAVGSLLAQVLPAQLATASARALMQHRHAGAGLAVWSTLHEQLFDLLALCAAGVVAVVLMLEFGWAAALAAGSVAVLVGLLGTGLTFRLAGRVAETAAAHLRPATAGRIGSFARALGEAAQLPGRLGAAMMALSLLRVACMAIRAVFVFAVLAPAASPLAVVIAFPVVQLAAVLPFVPGGLGPVEWIWTGVLAKGGMPPGEAAAAAVALRVVLTTTLVPVLAALLMLRMLRQAAGGVETRNR